MTSLDGLHRTTMFTETRNDDENEMLKATRKSLQELTDKYESQRIRVIELENELASAKEMLKIASTKSVFVPAGSILTHNPPWGSP
jgi:hypothetical protein